MNRIKKYLSTFVAFLLAGIATAQTQQVISSTGKEITGSNAQIDYTVGEPVITTLSSANNLITQGYHQSKLSALAINEVANPLFQVKVFPNPVENALNIVIEGLNQTATFRLFDIAGKLVAETKTEAEKSQLDFSGYAAGNYILMLNDSQGKTFSTQKITKSN